MQRFPTSKQQRDSLVQELLQDQIKFNQLVEEWIDGNIDDRYWWAFTFVIEQQPTWIDSHIGVLINKLRDTVKDDIKRNITRSLQYVKIPEKLASVALDECYKIMSSESEKTAQRVFSMTTIYNLVLDYPELSFEFQNILTDLYPFGSAGFKSRAMKIIKQLQKNPPLTG